MKLFTAVVSSILLTALAQEQEGVQRNQGDFSVHFKSKDFIGFLDCVRQNIQYWGGINKSTQEDSVENCQEKCRRTPGCTWFNWNHPSCSSCQQTNVCYLFSTKGPIKVAAQGRFSGGVHSINCLAQEQEGVSCLYGRRSSCSLCPVVVSENQVYHEFHLCAGDCQVEGKGDRQICVLKGRQDYCMKSKHSILHKKGKNNKK